MATMFNRKKETELWWIGVVAIAVLRVCTMNCLPLNTLYAPYDESLMVSLMGRLLYPQDMTAVTGACLMLRRDVWEKVNGLDEDWAVAFNDVDLCMRIRQKGYLVVFTPFAELYHYESRSRGSDETGEKRERFEKEAARFREKWAEETAEGDPYYNPNLTLRREDFSLKNLAETGREKERRNHTDRTGI